ncbi:DUF1674 domain-containing protein [Phenylobacterium sp.]|jgi:hypothetical protein|uniref:DUF1674 domain-containing protein n=2 Tax=Phenylobacterium sp. TaxID=1871053 RepID=UPI0025F32779|nr:DUF1674 domain-containing protein [Phenylobacterium sp.]MCA3736258.1 DUF1674 domain-containing protein [Phenylobacterium sp.]MCA6288081.1 DUF1674 domain-containing protein [Phenylobacterium sp.]MCA6299497.1 DUF1674 domain-containing protein [Phenylobacterium sp.]MCA6310616.1 DUF1674 domain-containing protein [Phenylobacterium sp.]MCA6323408.1 DUF1674 domain-containing protein [Phenylobacterium sp.]
MGIMEDDAPPNAAPGKALSPAARRALEEAAARKAAEAAEAERLAEQGGPAGLEPTRFGDWERKGIAVDF